MIGALVSAKIAAPPYGQRKDWIPRTEADFGDGGAFPEIHVAQYPLGKTGNGNTMFVLIFIYIYIFSFRSWGTC